MFAKGVANCFKTHMLNSKQQENRKLQGRGVMNFLFQFTLIFFLPSPTIMMTIRNHANCSNATNVADHVSFQLDASLSTMVPHLIEQSILKFDHYLTYCQGSQTACNSLEFLNSPGTISIISCKLSITDQSQTTLPTESPTAGNIYNQGLNQGGILWHRGNYPCLCRHYCFCHSGSSGVIAKVVVAGRTIVELWKGQF